ncbi:(deoxy)nucleoside triphosphate pyrophosphohydrolase [Leifsonia shinshuensis]|uniref:8-oxo-dGTP diphosphatase n=1 Tax=Leifsonia shinshuensis TaxID=150026 RepID=A0A7G6Y8Q4_9MICO|nr:(deoxy)nucleoside triphosphate pyrophosphohydrolase [Leifsonia shinshuensis]QNE34869.1 (deoxy)nucleoside triphosphate pyrophosphohydrolase [Leifsonia shinshuensis]
MTSPSRTLQVVAAVIVRDGAVLACRRAPHKDAAGRWEFPGGKVEAGETPEAALARELREELGVDVRVGALLDRTVTGQVDLACYAATLLGPAPTASTDHDALEWRGTGALAGLDWADADLPVVARLAELEAEALTAAAAVAPTEEEAR